LSLSFLLESRGAGLNPAERTTIQVVDP